MLTERVIRDAKATGKTFTVWDSKVPGLGLQVTAGGTKNYIVRYRAAGRKRQAILARAGGVSLADIRKRAAAELLQVRADGTDPLQRQHDAKQAPTVKDLVERFLNDTAPARIKARRMTPSTLRAYRNQCRRYVLPRLGGLRADKVTRRDIERFAERMADVPTMRNRTLALLSRLFNLAEHWEWRPQRTNPVRGVDRAREDARDRVLSPSEFGRLADALEGLDTAQPSAVAAIRVAAMSGMRITEQVDELPDGWRPPRMHRAVATESGMLIFKHTHPSRGHWHFERNNPAPLVRRVLGVEPCVREERSTDIRHCKSPIRNWGRAEAGVLRARRSRESGRTAPAGRMVLTVFAGIAEFERSLIATRTEEGRRAAQARGVPFGRPPKLRPDQRTLARHLIEEGKSVSAVARAFNVHVATIYRCLHDKAA